MTTADNTNTLIRDQPESDTAYVGYDTDKSLLNNSGSQHEGENHHHHHHHKNGCFKSKSARLVMMLLMVFSVFFIEALVGQITQSLTLLADSFHMLSDALALVVALVAVTYSKRRSNEHLKPWFSRNKYSNTFGWVRFEVVGALVNATFLLALCLSIAMEALEKFMNPRLPTDPNLVLIVGASGLVVNLLGLCLFGGHVGHNHDHKHSDHGNHSDIEEDTHKKEKTIKVHSHGSDQMNMRAVFLHVLGDALGSVVVVITALIFMFVPHEKEIEESSTSSPIVSNSSNCSVCPIADSERVTLNRWILYIDPAMSLILVCILCTTTIPLFKQSSFILMQSVPVHINIDELKDNIDNVPGVGFVHDLHIWQLAGERIIATIHIQVKDAETYERVAAELKSKLCDMGIHSLTIQPEFTPQPQVKTCYMDCSMKCNNNGICNPNSVQQTRQKGDTAVSFVPSSSECVNMVELNLSPTSRQSAIINNGDDEEPNSTSKLPLANSIA